jgi:hypothetical protein
MVTTKLLILSGLRSEVSIMHFKFMFQNPDHLFKVNTIFVQASFATLDISVVQIVARLFYFIELLQVIFQFLDDLLAELRPFS